MFKTFAVGAALTVALLAGVPAKQAEAKVDLDIAVGLLAGDGYGYGYEEVYVSGYDRDRRDRRYEDRRYEDRRDPRYGDRRDRRYEDRGYEDRRGYDEGVTCKYGRKMVSRQGFHSIEILDCEGRGYTYRARQDGHRYIVRTNRRGEIVRVERD